MFILREPDVKDSGASSSDAPAADASAQTDVNVNADPSAAQSDTPAQSGLEKAISDAYKASTSQTEADQPDKPGEESPVQEAQDEQATETATEAKEDQDKATEEDKAKGPIPYERFAEVNKAKAQVEQQLTELKPYVEAQQSINQFCQQHEITPDDFTFWMQVAALDKQDPGKALELLSPRLQSYQQVTGDVLPKDLQEAVDEGKMTLDYARRLAAAEGRTQLSQKQMQRVQQAQQEQQRQQYVQTMQSAMSSWSTSKRTTDPDFVPKSDANAPDGKYEFFLNRFTNDVKNAQIASVQDLVSLAEKTYAAVDASLSRFVPRRNGQKVLRSNQSNGTQIAAPKNVAEAVKARARQLGLVTSN